MLSDEEKTVLKTAKENYGLTSAEQKILVNLIEKQEKIIQAMAEEIAQFRNELDLINDTKGAVIDEYRKYIELLGVVFEKKVGE